MTTPASTYWATSVKSIRFDWGGAAPLLPQTPPPHSSSAGWPSRSACQFPQRLAGTQSPVLSSGGYTIFTSLNDCSGLVYWTTSIGGVHCCQYGPSPRVKLMGPFHPSNF